MEIRPKIPKYIRLTIYSYLSTYELLFGIALLSKQERDILPNSELIGAKKFHLKLKGLPRDSTSADYLVNYAKEVIFYVNSEIHLKILEEIVFQFQNKKLKIFSQKLEASYNLQVILKRNETLVLQSTKLEHEFDN